MCVLTGQRSCSVRAALRFGNRQIVAFRVTCGNAVRPQRLHGRRGIKHCIALPRVCQEICNRVRIIRCGFGSLAVAHLRFQHLADAAERTVNTVISVCGLLTQLSATISSDGRVPETSVTV